MTPVFKRKLGPHSNMLSGYAASFIVVNGAMFVWGFMTKEGPQTFLGATGRVTIPEGSILRA